MLNISDLFVKSLSGYFSNVKCTRPKKHPDYRVATCDLVTSQYTIELTIVFNPRNLHEEAPIIFCDEPWIRRDINWHWFIPRKCPVCPNTHRLCWINPVEWRVAHGKKLKIRLAREGSLWLYNNTRDLLDKHWIGNELGIKLWRDDWPQWSHGEPEKNEFADEIQIKGKPTNWEVLQ